MPQHSHAVLFGQALDKIRFESLTDKSKLDAQPELFIHLVPDKSNNTLTIIDSGVGMTKAGKTGFPVMFFPSVLFENSICASSLPNQILHRSDQ